MEQSPSWEASSVLANEEIPASYATQSLVPYSEDPTTYPYPKLELSIPRLACHFLKTYSNIIFPPMPRSCEWGLFFLTFWQKLCMHLSSIRATCPAHFYSFIWLPSQLLVRTEF
jgi:hypothetical protein